MVPSSHWAKLQLEGGLLRPLDKSKIATYSNIDPWILKQLAMVDPGNRYLVPWLWGFTTIGINVDKVKAALGDLPMPQDAWDLVFKPEYMSRLKSCGVSFLDSADEVFPAALRYIGKPPYSSHVEDYREAAAMLNRIRPDVTLFASSAYINELASGSVCAAIGWNGDIAIAAARAKEARNGQNIQILFPKSGAVLYFDTMAIPVDAPHAENAYTWMSTIYRPQVQAARTSPRTALCWSRAGTWTSWCRRTPSPTTSGGCARAFTQPSRRDYRREPQSARPRGEMHAWRIARRRATRIFCRSSG